MRIRMFLIGVIALLTAACQTVQTTQPGAVGVTRKQMMMGSEQGAEQDAQKAYRKQLEKARAKGSLNADQQIYQRVQKITRQLIAQTSAFRPNAVRWNWEVNVQTSDEVNAYCMPGGKIMVYTGLIEQLEMTDAELAAVIGHEISHALREHSRERSSRELVTAVAVAGIAIAAGAAPETIDAANEISSVTFTLPHSRQQEVEADRIGLELMARAGYDPNAAVSLWQKIAQLGGSRPVFLSTHPSSKSRARDLEAHMPRVLPLYEAAKWESDWSD